MSDSSFKQPMSFTPGLPHPLSRGASHAQSGVGCLPDPNWSVGAPVRDARLKSVRAKPYARGGGSCRGGCVAVKSSPFSVGFQEAEEEQLYDRMPAYLTSFSSFSSGNLLPCHNKQDIAHAALMCQKTISSDDLKAMEEEDEEEDFTDEMPQSSSDVSSPCLRPAASLSRLEEIKLSEAAEANERRILFIGRLPNEWANPEQEIRRILLGFGPVVKVTVKKRESGVLDSYAFVYFEESRTAHAALDFLQKNRKYRLLNVSFGGRDQFLLGQDYADLDSLPEAVALVCPTMHPNDVAAQLSKGRGLLRSSSQDSFTDLLKAHRRWQQKRCD